MGAPLPSLPPLRRSTAKPKHEDEDEDRILQLAATMHTPGSHPTLAIAIRAAACLTGHACPTCGGSGMVMSRYGGEDSCGVCDSTGVAPDVRYLVERVRFI